MVTTEKLPRGVITGYSASALLRALEVENEKEERHRVHVKQERKVRRGKAKRCFKISLRKCVCFKSFHKRKKLSFLQHAKAQKLLASFGAT